MAYANINFHHVKSIVVEKAPSSNVKRIVATDTEGKTLEIVLFGIDKESLEIKESES